MNQAKRRRKRRHQIRMFRNITLLLCMVVGVLIGCSKISESVRVPELAAEKIEKGNTIQARACEFIDWDMPLDAMHIHDDIMYGVYANEEGTFLVSKTENGVSETYKLQENLKDAFVRDFYVSEGIYYIAQKEQQLYLMSGDLKGNINLVEELTSESIDKFAGYEDIAVIPKEGKDFYLFCEAMVYPKDLLQNSGKDVPGDYYVVTNNILEFKDGKHTGKHCQSFSLMETSTAALYNDIVSNGEELFVLSSQPSGTEAFLEIYDKETWEVKEKIELTVEEGHNCRLCTDANGEIYVSSGKRMYQYNKDKKAVEDLFGLEELGIESKQVDKISSYGEGGFYVTQKNVSDTGWGYDYQISKIGEDIIEKKVITLGSVYSTWDSELTKVIMEYNQQSGEYFVEFQDWSEGYGDDLDAAYDRFVLDIVGGDGPDIIALDGMETQALGAQGILVDLYDYMTEDVARQKYVYHALECASNGSKLYGLGYGFNVNTISANGNDAGLTKGWTFSDFLAYLQGNGSGPEALYGFGGDESLITALGRVAMTDYIDWESNTANFQSEEFVNMLEFCKKNEQGNYQYPSFSKGLHEKYYLAKSEYINSVSDYQIVNELYDGNVVFKGYPTENGTGTTLAVFGPLGINSQSNVKEAAFDFIEFYAEEYDGSGFPIVTEKFEAYLEESMQEALWEDGSVICKNSYMDEDDYFEVFAATPEDVAAVRELINTADRSFYYNSSIASIIEEEASSYINGAISVEEAVETINNRVQLYLDEQK